VIYHLRIGIDLPSQNKWQRMHWGQQHALRGEVSQLVAFHLLHRPELLNLQPPVVLLVRQVVAKGQRSYDCDNCAPLQKLCIDALVDAGVLPNDSQKYIHAVATLRCARTDKVSGVDLVLLDGKEKAQWENIPLGFLENVD